MISCNSQDNNLLSSNLQNSSFISCILHYRSFLLCNWQDCNLLSCSLQDNNFLWCSLQDRNILSHNLHHTSYLLCNFHDSNFQSCSLQASYCAMFKIVEFHINFSSWICLIVISYCAILKTALCHRATFTTAAPYHEVCKGIPKIRGMGQEARTCNAEVGSLSGDCFYHMHTTILGLIHCV